MATHRILVVSADDVCVSPYIAALLARALPVPALGSEWDATTAGVSVPQYARTCELVVEQATGSGAAFLRAHRPRQLHASDTARAHLVLAATTADRAAVARLSPDARGRTFTVVEAALLGRAPLTVAQVKAVTVPGRAAASLRTYADLLNARRGTIEPRRSRWAMLRSGTPSDPLDLPDPHRAPRAHDRALSSIDTSVAEIGAQLDVFMRLATSSGSRQPDADDS